MARRSKPYELRWPITASQLENIDEMLQLLFDDTNNGSLDIRANQIRTGILAVPRGGTGIGTYVIGDLLYASDTQTLSRLAAVAAGKVLRSAGVATPPAYSTFTITDTFASGSIVHASSSNTLTALAIGASGTVVRSTGSLPAYSTFTIANTFAAGDIPHASSANTLTALTVGAAGKIIRSTGTLPAYTTFTIPDTFAQGDVVYASSANVLAGLTKDANATRYLSNTGASNNPAWAQVNLANGVTGDLPFANLTQIAGLSVLGVTGNATADVAAITANNDHQVLRRSGTALAFGQVNLAQGDAVTGTLAVTNGGTGTATQFTQGSVVFAGASGVYTQDNAKLFFDDTNNWLGVGTASPVTVVTITGANVSGKGILYVDGTDHGFMVMNAPTAGVCGLAYAKAGTVAWSTGMAISDTAYYISEGGSVGSNARLTILAGGNVGINATSPGSKLEVGGSFQCDSITNDTGLAAGTYTPTLTNVTNIDASTAYEAQYLRVGNTVTVSGKVDIDPTTVSVASELGVSLPVASNFGAEEDCGGYGGAINSLDVIAIRADAANNRAQFMFSPYNNTNRSYHWSFTYQVI